MRKSNQRPLSLSTQTIRVLTGARLSNAIGGLSDPGHPGGGDPGAPGGGDPGAPPRTRPHTTTH